LSKIVLALCLLVFTGGALQAKLFLGVTLENTSSTLTSQLGLKDGQGLIISGVIPHNAAQKAGIQKGDILIRMANQEIFSVRQLSGLMSGYEAGDNVEVVVLRKGREVVLNVTMQERQRGPSSNSGGTAPESYEIEVETSSENLGFLENLEINLEQLERELEKIDENADDISKEVEKKVKIAVARATEAAAAAIARSAIGEKIAESRKTMVFESDEGTLMVEVSPEGRHITALNPQGEVIYDGLIDDPEKTDSLPSNVRKQLENLDKRTSELQRKGSLSLEVTVEEEES